MESYTLIKLKKNLILQIVKFCNKIDILNLINSKNKKLFKNILEAKNVAFGHFYLDPKKLKFKGKFTDYDGFPLMDNFAIFKNYDKQLVLACPINSFCLSIINIQNSQLIFSLKGHTKQIYFVKYYKKEKYLITSSHDKSVKIWNIKELNCQLTINNCYNSEYR